MPKVKIILDKPEALLKGVIANQWDSVTYPVVLDTDIVCKDDAHSIRLGLYDGYSVESVTANDNKGNPVSLTVVKDTKVNSMTGTANTYYSSSWWAGSYDRTFNYVIKEDTPPAPVEPEKFEWTLLGDYNNVDITAKNSKGESTIVTNGVKLPADTYDIMVTAKNGYLISKANEYDRNGKEVLFTLSSDEQYATRNKSVSGLYKINIVTKVKPVVIPEYPAYIKGSNFTATAVNENTGDTRVLNSTSTLPDGTWYVTITADSGYKLKTISQYDDYGGQTETPINDVEYSFNEVTYYGMTEKTVTTEKIPDPPTNFYWKLLGNFENAKLTATNSKNEVITLYDGIMLPQDTYTIKVESNTGYVLKKVFRYDRYGREVLFTLSDDKKTGEHSGSFDGIDITVVTETAPTKPIDPPPENSLLRFNNIYLMTIDRLKALAHERFKFSIGDPDKPINIDLGEYIINILEIPLTIHDDLIGNLEKIQLGSYSVDVEADEILGDEVVFNLGNIFIPETFKNSLDYQNTTIKLNLPYIDTLDIDVEYAINQTIGIFYIIDMYSGNATVNITSTKTGTVIYSNRFNIGRQIPFLTSTNVKQGNLSDQQGLNNTITKANIEVIRNIPRSIDSKVTDYGIIKDVMGKGLITIYDVDLRTHATSEEQSTIKSLLSEGVYIR